MDVPLDVEMSNRSTPSSALSATARRFAVVLFVVSISLSLVGAPAAASDHCTTETTTNVPVDVVFVIDTSGSMTDQEMESTKSATKTAIDALPDNAQVGVIDFDSDSVVVHSLSTDQNGAKTAVDGLADGGGTDMPAGIQDGLDELTGSSARDEAKKVMVVLGDGDVDVPSEALADEGKEDHDIRFITISVGGSAEVQKLKYIAGTTPGEAGDEGDYYPSPSEADIESAFQSIVSSITEVECESDGEDTDRLGPRFEVSDIQWTDTNPTVGESVNVTYTVENVGDREGWFKGIVTSDMDRVDRKIAELEPGETETFTVEVSWDQHGDHRLFVRTHYLGEVTVDRA